jgi:hypothetical protein
MVSKVDGLSIDYMVGANQIYTVALFRSPTRLNSRSYPWVQFTCRSYLLRVIPPGCIRVHKLTPYRWGTQSHESRERVALSFSSTILYTTDLASALIYGILTGSIRAATLAAISARSNFGPRAARP